MRKLLLTGAWLLAALTGFAQRNAAKTAGNEVYVDARGIIRYSDNGREAAYFGVNYTLPFAYGYRSHKVQNIDNEQAIDRDVYHLARLGVNAFRVHVWDTEITDSLGNLKQNEHLRLFDYLLARLEERNIRIIITPIAFWGNGYPERDERTGSFSDVYGKDGAVVKEPAFKAQENYLKQFFSHVNPYTKKTYTADRFVIATEINNEPHHSGPKERTTEYVNRMMAAIRSAGWTKPVFYNISESPWYADAVAKSNVNGYSFQWYPTGLVAGHQQKGNLLPLVDKYVIPFDTIPQFKNKARMVYEFDAGDVMQPYMYPAMARSFKAAGFQWATQFAYDPMGTAFANTEYQTHYLNLAYTPSKAISLLIAGKVFRQLPTYRARQYFPADTVFGPFRVSYAQQLSEMNTETEFYYSNNTSTQPKKAGALQHIAGVGSSPVVKYAGKGAYFLDKLPNGAWRLEVMPDAVMINDPFEKASLAKEVTRIVSASREMVISLPGLGQNISISALNEGNGYTAQTTGGKFMITPGTYLLQPLGKKLAALPAGFKTGELGLREFVAPMANNTEVDVYHQPHTTVSANVPFTISATITGVQPTDTVMLQLNRVTGAYKLIKMQADNAFTYSAVIPADVVQPGLLNYRIMLVRKGGEYLTFPGKNVGNPFTWDYVKKGVYETLVAAKGSPVQLYQPAADREQVTVYAPEWRNDGYEYITGLSGGLMLKLFHKPTANKQLGGFELFIKDKLTARQTELENLRSITLNAETMAERPVKVVLIDKDANAYSVAVTLTPEKTQVNIPLSAFKKDNMVLLPRPYPGFQSLQYQSPGQQVLQLKNIEKIQLLLEGDAAREFSVAFGGISLAN